MQSERLTIKKTATGYWTVQRGAVHLTGATTRKGAEAERDLLKPVGRFKQLLLQEVLEELQHFGILATAETTDGPLASLDRCCGISSNFD